MSSPNSITPERLTPVTDSELDEFIQKLGSGSINWETGKRIGNELKYRRARGKDQQDSPSVAIELAQLSRELVQHSREMRAQEKKIVELEKQRDMFRESSKYMNNQFMRCIGVFVKITEGEEDAIELAREALEKR